VTCVFKQNLNKDGDFEEALWCRWRVNHSEEKEKEGFRREFSLFFKKQVVDFYF